MRRPATESAALPSWRPNTAAPAPTANAAETTKAATKRPAPALRGAFREGWVMEPGPEPKELQALYKVRHLQALELRKRQSLRESQARERLSAPAPRDSRKDDLVKRAAARRASSPSGSSALAARQALAEQHHVLLKTSPQKPLAPPPRGPMLVVASPVRRTAEEIRAACTRLSDHVMHTIGERYLLNLRTTCAARYSARFTTIMRLQHVTAQLASKRENVMKLTMGGSELLASIVGCPTETVGELLPGSKLSKDNIADDAFVSACVRRRVLLSHPDCWLALNKDGYAELTVELLETGAKIPLHVRPTAKTELVYCLHPNTRVRIINKAEKTDKRERTGYVEQIRDDGMSMIVFDGSTDPAVPVDLRSPLIVSEAESLHRTSLKLAVEGTNVKVSLDIVLRPPEPPKFKSPNKKGPLWHKSPRKHRHPSPPRPSSVPGLIIPLSAGHNRQPSPSEASEAEDLKKMISYPPPPCEMTAATEANRLAMQDELEVPGDDDTQTPLQEQELDLPPPSPVQSLTCASLFQQIVHTLQGNKAIRE